jgi:hypothetical protein
LDVGHDICKLIVKVFLEPIFDETNIFKSADSMIRMKSQAIFFIKWPFFFPSALENYEFRISDDISGFSGVFPTVDTEAPCQALPIFD